MHDRATTREESGFSYDLFVSYASEDLAVVEPLVARLVRAGYTVWFDRTEMHATGAVAGNLWRALNSCRQTLVCLSETYCAKRYTLFELEKNFEIDPGNRDKRTLVTVVKGPLHGELPPEISTIPRIDLTNTRTYEAELERLRRSILPPLRPVSTFPHPQDILAMRRLTSPDELLLSVRRGAVNLFGFLCSRLNSQPAPDDITQMADALCQSRELEAEIKSHIQTIPAYARLIDVSGNLTLASIEPAFQALMRISSWTCSRFEIATAGSDPFEGFWLETAPQLPTAELPIQLAGNGRIWTPLGAVYEGREPGGAACFDLLVIPARREQAENLAGELRDAVKLKDSNPLPVEWRRSFDRGGEGIWYLLVFERAEGPKLQAMVERFAPIPGRLANAIRQAVRRSFRLFAGRCPALAANLFRCNRLVVDRDGRVRLGWEWAAASTGPALAMEELWFRRAAPAGEVALSQALSQTRGAMEAALAELLGAESEPARDAESSGEEDHDVLRGAVESYLDGRKLPGWLAASAPEPEVVETRVPDKPPEPGELKVLKRIGVDCLRAWPLGDGLVLAWKSDESLSIFAHASGEEIWSDREAFHLRTAALGPGGGVAIASWEGEVRWFDAAGKSDRFKLNAAVGDLKALGGRWLAGAWSGDLKEAGAEGVRRLPEVSGGVRQIAAGPDGSFAIRSLQDTISIYRGHELGAQVGPLAGVLDIGFNGAQALVLTRDGLIPVSRSGRLGEVDRLPSRSGLRLLAHPAEPVCLLVNGQGQSWKIDAAGTYPRGPWFPACDAESISTSRGFSRGVAGGQLGYVFWRDGQRVKAWRDAIWAAMSPNGRRIAVAIPGWLEVLEDMRP